MAQACIMHSATLADEDGAARAHLPANGAGSPQAAFITSAARCKRKAAAAACAGTPAQPREADADGCAAVPTPVKTIKLLHAFGWLSAAGGDAEDGDAARCPVSPRGTAGAPLSAPALSQAQSLDLGATPVAAPVQSPRPPEDEEVGWEFDPYLFIKRLPSLEECVPPRTSYLLPRRSRRCPQKTLVLDLDETLVHSTLDGPSSPPDFCFSVEVGGAAHRVAVRQRPHLHTFLRAVSALYEVVVFTASQAVYAEQLLDVVDPGRTLIRHRVFRDACVQWEGNYLKDLTVLGRDLAHTLIVDNSPQAFGFQLDNGVPIESWYDDDEDEELLRLLPFLESVAHVDDVRPAIQSRFRLREVVEAVQDPCGDWRACTRPGTPPQVPPAMALGLTGRAVMLAPDPPRHTYVYGWLPASFVLFPRPATQQQPPPPPLLPFLCTYVGWAHLDHPPFLLGPPGPREAPPLVSSRLSVNRVLLTGQALGTQGALRRRLT
ncbi:hypothetical protein ACKKBF_B05285 [Auxenochlorella protothecoides x Auxenochlorella symbiontica]